VATQAMEGFPAFESSKIAPKERFGGLGAWGLAPTPGPIACLGPISLPRPY